jgi:hypothetical protein
MSFTSSDARLLAETDAPRPQQWMAQLARRLHTVGVRQPHFLPPPILEILLAGDLLMSRQWHCGWALSPPVCSPSVSRSSHMWSSWRADGKTRCGPTSARRSQTRPSDSVLGRSVLSPDEHTRTSLVPRFGAVSNETPFTNLPPR